MATGEEKRETKEQRELSFGIMRCLELGQDEDGMVGAMYQERTAVVIWKG